MLATFARLITLLFEFQNFENFVYIAAAIYTSYVKKIPSFSYRTFLPYIWLSENFFMVIKRFSDATQNHFTRKLSPYLEKMSFLNANHLWKRTKSFFFCFKNRHFCTLFFFVESKYVYKKIFQLDPDQLHSET